MLILEKYKAWLEGYGRCKIQWKMKENEQNEPIRKCIIFIKVEFTPPPPPPPKRKKLEINVGKELNLRKTMEWRL